MLLCQQKSKELIKLLLTQSHRRYHLIDFLKSICPEQKKSKKENPLSQRQKKMHQKLQMKSYQYVTVAS